MVAVLTGLLIARLPIVWAAAGLFAVALVVLTLKDPLIGLGAALVLGPTKPLTDYFLPQLPLDFGQLALIVTLGAWLLHTARRHTLRIPRSPLNLPLFIFIGTAGLSLLNALSLGSALTEMIKWVQMLLVMWLVIEEAGVRRWPLVVGMVLAAAALQGAIGVWQFGLRGAGPEHFLILNDRFYRAYGTFEQPNPYAGFLGLTLPVAAGLALGALEPWVAALWQSLRAARPIRVSVLLQGLFNRHIWRLVAYATLSLLLLAGLLMSWSRGAWLGAAAAALVLLFAWPRRSWIGALLMAGGLLMGVAALELDLLPASITERLTGFTGFVETFDVRGQDINDANYSVLERLAHWQAAREMVRYHPVLGVGFGNYEDVYPGYALLNWPYPLGHAHNIYLNTLAETGIIGFLAYAALWVSVLWNTWQVTRGAELWQRSLAVGLLASWTYLSAHQFVDKLYVANIHLHIGALLGVLSLLLAARKSDQKVNVEHNG